MSLTTRSQMSNTSSSAANSYNTRNSPRKMASIHNKPKCPFSLSTIYSNAETVVSKYNKKIESFYNKHNWEELLEPTETTKLYEELKNKGVVGKFYSAAELSEHMEREGIQQPDNIGKFGQLYDDMKTQITRNIQNTFTVALLEGVATYCLPLGELCITELPVVRQYEKNYLRYETELSKDIVDLFSSVKAFNKLTVLKYLKNASDSCELIKKIRSAINKIYYLVVEWVEADQGYVEEIVETLREKEQELQEVQELQQNYSQSQPHLNNSNKKKISDIEKLEELVRSLKQKLHKCNNSVLTATQRQTNLKEKMRNQMTEKENIEQRLEKMEKDKEKMQQQNQLHQNSPIITEMKSTNIELKNIINDMDKTKDNLQSISRLIKHQEKSKSTLHSELQMNKKKLTKTKKKMEKDKETQEKSNCDITELESKKLILINEINDLKLLKDKKTNTTTLREIHATGHVHSPRKASKPIEAACKEVAEEIGVEWRNLYGQLPMERTKSTRRRDVERMDVYGARHDITEPELAALSLEKWRLFCPTTKPAELIQALTYIDKPELADKLQHKFKYKK